MNRIFEVDVTVLAFLTGSLMPLLTALATKLMAGPKVKALVNLGLSLLAGGLSVVVAGDGKFSLIKVAAGMIAAYLASGVSYQNLWKPTGVAPVLARKTENVGVGNGWNP